LRTAGGLAEEEWEVATLVVFLLLKAGPPTNSSSSSDSMCTTPSFPPKGAWGEAALTMAKGMASMGAVKLATSFGEPGVGVAGVVAAEGMVVEVG